MKEKFRVIYLPFLLLSIGLTIGYSILYLVFGVKLKLVPSHSTWVLFVGPIILAGLTVLSIMLNRIKLFNYKIDGRIVSTFVCILLLAAPIVAAQDYIAEQKAELTEVDKPSQIDIFKQTRYYAINEGVVLKKSRGIYITTALADSRGNQSSFIVFFAAPIIDSVSSENKSLIWIGKSYRFTYQTVYYKKYKEEITNFYYSSIDEFNDHAFDLSYLVNQQTFGGSESLKYAIENSEYYDDEKEYIVLTEPGRCYEMGGGHGLRLFLIFLLGGNLIWLIIVAVTPVNKTERKSDATM